MISVPVAKVAAIAIIFSPTGKFKYVPAKQMFYIKKFSSFYQFFVRIISVIAPVFKIE